MILFLLLAIGTIGCSAAPQVSESVLEISLPKQSDWVDYGTIFEAGEEGEWDHLLWGGFTGTAVKLNGTYYLYYQGAEEYLGAPDDTVAWRAIGVATSQDGINFTKYNGNPVVTWSPSGYPNGIAEEGAASGGVTLDANGDFALFYGANTAYSPTKVNADGRLAVSEDGLNFKDAGIVLDHADGSLWGSGDELFPIAAIHDADQWIVYYLPNGLGKGRNLGVAWGDARDELQESSAARSDLAMIDAWGMAGTAQVSPNTYAIFTNWVTDPRIEARLISPDTPNSLSDPVEIYRFEDVSQATILLDEETATWFMYYRAEDHYGVKMAPAGPVDMIPPTAPTSLTAVGLNGSQVNLSWEPAEEIETGIAHYKIFRDGNYLTSVKGLGFRDTGLDKTSKHTYAVSAINYHGIESPRSAPVTSTTLDLLEASFLPCQAAASQSGHG